MGFFSSYIIRGSAIRRMSHLKRFSVFYLKHHSSYIFILHLNVYEILFFVVVNIKARMWCRNIMEKISLNKNKGCKVFSERKQYFLLERGYSDNLKGCNWGDTSPVTRGDLPNTVWDGTRPCRTYEAWTLELRNCPLLVTCRTSILDPCVQTLYFYFDSNLKSLLKSWHIVSCWLAWASVPMFV